MFDKPRAAISFALFFDELYSIAVARRGRQGDEGGAAEGVINHLSTEMNGVGAKKKIVSL